MNNHFALPGFDVPRHFLVGWMVCWWLLSSDGVMLRDANLFDKFASHFLEHFIFHTGIIQSLILVTRLVQNSLFTKHTLVVSYSAAIRIWVILSCDQSLKTTLYVHNMEGNFGRHCIQICSKGYRVHLHWSPIYQPSINNTSTTWRYTMNKKKKNAFNCTS